MAGKNKKGGFTTKKEGSGFWCPCGKSGFKTFEEMRNCKHGGEKTVKTNTTTGIIKAQYEVKKKNKK